MSKVHPGQLVSSGPIVKEDVSNQSMVDCIFIFSRRACFVKQPEEHNQ